MDPVDRRRLPAMPLLEYIMSIPKAIEGAMNRWNSVETALRAANPGASKEDIYHATADAMNRSLGLPQGERRTVFDDGTYRVQVGRLFAVIARRDGAEFYVPTHHAWFDRVATADCRRTVEDLHTELVTTTA